MALIARFGGEIARCTGFNGAAIRVNLFNTSCVRHLDQEWRAKKGLTKNPNSFGPLTNLPDYSFKDGRPTPLGRRQTTRILKQRDYAAKIVKLAGEVDFALERHEKLKHEEAEKRQKILDSKLKPKGHLLLSKK